MSDEKNNGKIILIATIICIVIGVAFVFRLDKKFINLFNNDSKKNQTPIVNTANDPELQNLPQLPNMIVIYGGQFLTKEITVKVGDVVTFYNIDNSPAKVIGKNWQSAFINKTGAFAKGDFTKGEYTAYLDGKPNEIIKIKVK